MLDIIKKLIRRKPTPISTGDFVVCIEDRSINSENFAPPPIIYGQVYKVSNICVCKNCKKRVFDVGLPTVIPRFTKCGCDGKRGRFEFPGANIHWAGEFRFRKVEKKEILKIKELNGVKTLDLM